MQEARTGFLLLCSLCNRIYRNSIYTKQVIKTNSSDHYHVCRRDRGTHSTSCDSIITDSMDDIEDITGICKTIKNYGKLEHAFYNIPLIAHPMIQTFITLSNVIPVIINSIAQHYDIQLCIPLITYPMKCVSNEGTLRFKLSFSSVSWFTRLNCKLHKI